MSKQRSPDSYQAEELYRSGARLIDIARELNLPEGTVRRWKHSYGWDSERSDKKNERSEKRKRGAPPGNQNAAGHGAPKGNQNARKHGLFSRYLPEDTREIFFSLDEAEPLDLLWDQIKLAYTAILRAQPIMYVTDRYDKTVEKIEEKNGNIIGERWEVQQAWDKQAHFLQAQAKAQSELRSMIKQYDEMLHKNWEAATDEQKARIEQMKANAERLRRDRTEADGEDGVVIVNDAPAGEDIGNNHTEIPADI